MTQRHLGLLVIVTGILMTSSSAIAASDPVVTALSVRHMTATTEQLEGLAGGADALVAKLLELRSDENTPFVGIRAEKYLLQYADRPEVAAALDQDVKSDTMVGLARVIAMNVDKIPSAKARQSLAQSVIDRGKQQTEFKPYAQALTSSSDPEVSALARAAFGG